MGRNRDGREQRGSSRNAPQGSSQLTYLLPKESAQIVGSKIGECHNLSLILARYIPQQVIKNSDVPDEKNMKWRDKWLKEQCRRFAVTKLELKKHIESTHRRWELTTSNTERFKVGSLGRLVVGLGGESVLETSLTLQFITGLPIIPGSALKGLCRHYALFTIAAELGIQALSAAELATHHGQTPLQQLDDSLAEATWEDDLVMLLREHDMLLVAEMFRAIFGSTDHSGACVFYDAVVSSLPKSGTLFEVDVMTPHFVKYYNSANAGKQIEPPSDNDSPNPINFLTVAAGTEFAFAVGVRRGFDKSLAEQAAKWLKTALYEMGVGAKTAAGYGVFEKVK